MAAKNGFNLPSEELCHLGPPIMLVAARVIWFNPAGMVPHAGRRAVAESREGPSPEPGHSSAGIINIVNVVVIGAYA